MTARVFHAELWGDRADKYQWLFDHDVASHKWTPLNPNSPHYFFVPRDESVRGEYESGWTMTELMPTHGVGMVTARDALTIDFDSDALWRRVHQFSKIDADEARTEYSLGADVQSWKVAWAQADVRRSGPSKNLIRPVLYRPFDQRFTYYTGKSSGFICRPVYENMRHMQAGENLALITVRQVAEGVFDHVLATRWMVESRITLSNKGIGFVFPLYLYPSAEAGADKLFAAGPGPGKSGRRPNLSPQFVAEFGEKLGLAFVADGTGDLKKTFGPEDIFHYAYAVFHSPTYRSRYAQFLKIDFPRVPLTNDKKLFARLCALGAELVGLHLLERVPAPAARYPQPGGNTVEKPRYKPPTDEAPGRVYVNNGQYFENIPPEVWEFHVGGYQVCEKWLKDRRGRRLSYDDIETYRSITEAIRQTVRVMPEIDSAIPSWPLP